jgi:membrane associated rhomboid family serine protease
VIPIKDRNPTRNFPYVTIVLILANVAVFVLVQKANSDVAGSNRFTLEHAAIPCELRTGEPLSYEEIVDRTCRADDRATFTAQLSNGTEGQFTNSEPFSHKNIYLAVLVSMFLHGGWLHLGGNMLFLWIFGNNVEDVLGPVRYLAFYVLGGLAAAVTYLVFNASSVVPVLGASGAIAAVMGAYLAWFPRAKILTLVFVVVIGFFTELKAYWVLLVWFVLQFFTNPNSGVAWAAHVGGFIFGFLIAFAVARTPWFRRRQALLADWPA